MSAWIITAAKVLLDGQFHEGLEVKMEDGRIVEVGERLQGGERLCAPGKLLTPGLIDMHIHGLAGYDLASHPERVLDVAAKLPRYGVTAFLPTCAALPPAQMHHFVKVVATLRNSGAYVVGCHLEGPFLDDEFCGAINPDALFAPSREAWHIITDGYEDWVRMMTMDPAAPHALEMADYLADRGIIVSAGHSGADYAAAMDGFDHGFTKVTHLFNAMRGLHHREPALVGAALTTPGVRCEVICDLIHIHPAVLYHVYQSKGVDGMLPVTDAMMAAGLGEGVYELAGARVIVRGDEARLEAGNLAGSTLTMDRAMRNLVRIGIPAEDALTMATRTAARAIGEDGRMGSIAPGYRADLVLWTPDLTVDSAYVAGQLWGGARS